MVIPWFSIPETAVKEMVGIAEALNEALGIRGPFNIQFLVRGGDVYVIELNLRASRSMPFTSKATGYNLMRAAAEAALEGRISYGFNGSRGFKLLRPRGWWAVKSPQFSWQRLRGAYPGLGPEMKSTGEVAALGRTLHEALLKSWLSVQGNHVPAPGSVVLVYTPTVQGRAELGRAASLLAELGYTVYTLEGMDIEGVELLPLRKALELARARLVGMLATTGYAPHRDYTLRRLAADLGVPLVLDARLAEMLAEALSKVGLDGLEARELSEYWGLGKTLF
jgi:carbamoyl-phosphate synthase large subunit